MTDVDHCLQEKENQLSSLKLAGNRGRMGL